MSVTVSDLLQLPSLRDAKVLAGRGGLSRIVSSISVLEYADPGLLMDQLFHNNDFYGSEIVITGFISVKDNVPAQCANIRRLAEAGEVGLILYYVGILLPRVDKQLIALADSLNFTLICMPENRMDLRYSEVICEVMEAIFKDQKSDGAFVGDLLDRIARLPQHQRTVDTALKMLSDRIRSCVVLTDASGRILNEAAWPRGRGEVLYADQCLTKFTGQTSAPVIYPFAPNCLLSHFPIRTGSTHDMVLFLIKEGDPLPPETTRQAAEIVQLAVSIWSEQHDEIVVTELVRAILQDEPMKMHRLADIFHIDVASINTMWILKCEKRMKPDDTERLMQLSRELLTGRCNTIVMDIYEGDVVIFMDDRGTLQESETLARELYGRIASENCPIRITLCGALADTTEVRNAFLLNRSSLEDAKKIFPGRAFYHLQTISYAKACRTRVEQGELSVKTCLSALSALSGSEGRDLLNTLSIYLLDADFSVTRTAELLFLHKNTVKYRLQSIGDRLGYHIGRMPESLGVYEAVALNRLLTSSSENSR